MASVVRAFTLALGLSAAIGTVSAQAAVQTLEVSFASLVQAAQEQRVAHPTPTPKAIRRAGFERRQQTTSGGPTLTYVTEAPDATCGFLSASPGNAITCLNGGICSWEGTHVSAIICADATKGISFSAKLACYESKVATDTAVCNDVCQENEFNLLCTESTAAFCRTYIYPGSIRDFRCASTSVDRPQSVDFTYRGQTDRAFDTITWGGSETVSGGSSISRPALSENTETDTSTSTAESTTTTSSDPTPDPAPPGGGGGTNVGAIVGGTVGGAALIALIGFGVFFMRRHSAKKDAALAAQQPPADQGAPPVQQYYGAPTPVSPAPGYNWKGGAASPVHTTVSGGQPPYDAVSDIQSSRMSQVYSPGPGPQQVQPTNTPGTIHEVEQDTSGHHRGNLHEIG